MKFFRVYGQGAGTLGEDTVFIGADTERPAKVAKLNYDFEVFPTDSLVCSLGQYIGTAELRTALEALSPKVTGIEFDDVQVTMDDQVMINANEQFPRFYWFKINGRLGQDDFSVLPDCWIVVSERIRKVLDSFPKELTEIETYNP